MTLVSAAGDPDGRMPEQHTLAGGGWPGLDMTGLFLREWI